MNQSKRAELSDKRLEEIKDKTKNKKLKESIEEKQKYINKPITK